MLKEPSTIKMRRLLEQLVESDARNTSLIRELQQDARKVIGLYEPAPAAEREAATGSRRKKPAAAGSRKTTTARRGTQHKKASARRTQKKPAGKRASRK